MQVVHATELACPKEGLKHSHNDAECLLNDLSLVRKLTVARRAVKQLEEIPPPPTTWCRTPPTSRRNSATDCRIQSLSESIELHLKDLKEDKDNEELHQSLSSFTKEERPEESAPTATISRIPRARRTRPSRHCSRQLQTSSSRKQLPRRCKTVPSNIYCIMTAGSNDSEQQPEAQRRASADS